MASQFLQGTLDLMILYTPKVRGSKHFYGIAKRLIQISDDALTLNKSTTYPALVRFAQYQWTRGSWGRTKSNREANYHHHKSRIEDAAEEPARWRRMAEAVEELLAEEQ